MRAIVTGAASGIGAALAQRLLRDGWTVAVLALSRNLARELGPRGIAVNCVALGPTETPMMASTLEPAEAVRGWRASRSWAGSARPSRSPPP